MSYSPVKCAKEPFCQFVSPVSSSVCSREQLAPGCIQHLVDRRRVVGLFNFTPTSPFLLGSSKMREKHDFSLGEKSQER